jgi:hypothetical protein
VHSRPLIHCFHQILFDPVAEHVPESPDLGGFFITHDDCLVAPRPDLVAPADEATDLAGQIRVDVAHEAAELVSVVDVQEEVEVVAGQDVTTNPSRVLPLGSAENANDDLVEYRARAQEEAAVDGAGGHLDQGTAFGDKA